MLSVVGRGKLYKNDSFLDLKLIITSQKAEEILKEAKLTPGETVDKNKTDFLSDMLIFK